MLDLYIFINFSENRIPIAEIANHFFPPLLLRSVPDPTLCLLLPSRNVIQTSTYSFGKSVRKVSKKKNKTSHDGWREILHQTRE